MICVNRWTNNSKTKTTRPGKCPDFLVQETIRNQSFLGLRYSFNSNLHCIKTDLLERESRPHTVCYLPNNIFLALDGLIAIRATAKFSSFSATLLPAAS